MPVLDDLCPVADLYDYRGPSGAQDAPPLWLPHHQGDVFTDVDVPGVENRDRLVMLFMHPCTMRKGAVLKDHVTVLAVRTESPRRVLDDPARWSRHYSVMPLPDLHAAGRGTHTADFTALGTVPSSALNRDRRIATLSLQGRYLFQQRIINHLTRHVVAVHELREATSAVEAEIELQGHWVEAATVAAGTESERTVADAEAAFDAYLRDEDRRRRLSDVTELARVLGEAHREISRRYR